MIRKATLLLASTAALALAGTAQAQSAQDETAADIELLQEQDDAGAEASTPTMSFGTWGVDPDLLPTR